MRRWLPVILAGALAVAMVGAAWAAPDSSGEFPEPGPAECPCPQAGGQLHRPILRGLDLTEEQIEALRQLREAWRETHRERREQLRELRGRIRDAVEEGDDGLRRQLWAELGECLHEMREEFQQHRQELLNILTDEQKQKLEELREEHRPRPGPGRFPRGSWSMSLLRPRRGGYMGGCQGAGMPGE